MIMVGDDMNYEKIGDFISKKRKEKNLTQKELAFKIGVTDKAVSKWERGLGCPDVSILEMLASVLNVTILEILKGRIIENEIIPVTEVNDYIKDTVKISNDEINKKSKEVFKQILSIVIIVILSFLSLLNVSHILYLNTSEVYNFDNKDLILKLEEIKANINLIEKNTSLFNKEDYNNILHNLNESYEILSSLEVLKYNGEKSFKLKDLNNVFRMNGISFDISDSYRILSKYDSSYKDYLNLYSLSFSSAGFGSLKLYNEPELSYAYYLYGLNLDDYSRDLGVYARMYRIEYTIEEVLYLTKNVIKAGEINE